MSWAANQAVDIIRRNLKRTSVQPPKFDGRMVHRNFAYMPCFDGGYFSDRLPEPAVVCPEERDALVWQKNINAPDPLTGTTDPDPAANDAALNFKFMYPFWSTYQMVPYTWTYDSPANPSDRIYQAGKAGAQGGSAPGYHLVYSTPISAKFLQRKMDHVAFPSQKVWTFDLFDRHTNPRKQLFHAYPTARQPLLFFDGQVTVRKTRDSNPGWDPLFPTATLTPTRYFYMPQPTEPRTLTGQPQDLVTGYYRWTRWGLRGVDFGGGEVKK